MAQEPERVPRDTVPADTLIVPIPPAAVAGDTLPGDSIMPAATDSLIPAPELPEFPDPLPTGWAFARMELTRDELLRYRGLSVLDLIERLPGVTVIRSGGFGRAAGLSAGGSGGGALRVYIDGYEIDAIGQPTPELQAIGLIDLASLRVERDATGVRVEMTTFRLPDQRPYSEVEAAAGNYATRLLRATLARAAGTRSVFSAAYDLTTTNGVGLFEPFQARGGRVSWSYLLTPETGLRLELRQRGVERRGEAYPVDVTRRDLVLRARSTALRGLVVEALAGRTWWRPEAAERTDGGAGPAELVREAERAQGLLRAAWTGTATNIEAAARVRSGSGGARAPSAELTLRGSTSPLPWVVAEGEIRTATIGGVQATGFRGGGRVGPFAGLSAFATVSGGERWIGLARDTLVTYPDTVRVDTIAGEPVPVIEDRQRLERVFGSTTTSAAGARVGLEATRWGATIGAALVTSAPAIVAPFGFGFDRAIAPLNADAATGVEGYAYLPIPWTSGDLRLEGSASSWSDTGGRPYLPSREARLALEFHTVRIEGQFEPTIRLEAVHRGRTLVPTPEADAFGFVTEPYTLLNFLLQIRILDVRAFLIWENPTHNRLALDLPEGLGFQPGQRVIYGARWSFRN